MVNENELSLNVYPNPAINTITIEGMKGEGQLINALGLVIATVNNGQIDVKELQAGVYLIRCGNETIKFVKK